MSKTIQPTLEKRSFTCPRCGIVCPQELFRLEYSEAYRSPKTLHNIEDTNELYVNSKKQAIDQYILKLKRDGKFQEGLTYQLPDKAWDLYITVCTECERYAVWENGRMIFPFTSTLPEPAEDIPENVRMVYVEAAQVFKYSPRSSAALLRLAIEALLPQLPNYTINNKKLVGMIGELVAQGIPAHLQKALDSIRLYGNQGIHTAEIIDEDDTEIGIFLFELINVIVKELITDKKKIDAFYSSFPASKLAAIAQRDNK
jgi:hypothetical protein